MAVKKSIYIEAELEWAEAQLTTWRKFVDEHPYHLVEDRKELMKSKTGGAYNAVVAKREEIQKSLRDTMKEYLALLREVNNMRELEDAKKSTPRGNQALSPLEEGML